MERPRTPYREVVDKENTDILGTLTSEMWACYQEARVLAEFYDVPEIADELLQVGIRMSSAVGGDHRRDLVQSIQNAKAPTMAMGLAQPVNGHAYDDRVIVKDVRRPGL